MKNIIYILMLFLASNIYSQITYKTKVYGVCDMCKDRIERTSKNTIGVISASWDKKTLLLTIIHDGTTFNENELHQNLSNEGHSTEKLKANEEVYKTLPLCCNYSDPNNIHRDHDHSEDEDLTNKVIGVIYEKNEQNKKIAVIGAEIKWLNTEIGTKSKSNGSFEIDLHLNSNKLVISYFGYENDTIIVDKPGAIEVVLREGVRLNEVLIKGRKRTIEVSYISPIKLRKISQRELTKAACCNLSESFETNPAVDVSYTDAITGTKQIEMLGLAGSYVQITRENMPDIRGLASIYGLSFIPGPWIESIQMSLGAGSVINGFESIAGQINVEIKKPMDTEKLHINGYYGGGGRIEGNIIANTTVNDNFDTNVLLHYNQRGQAHDNNFDGFLDMPKGYGYSLQNNWKYYGDNGNEAEFGIKITKTDNTSGQDIAHHEGLHPPGYVLWKAKIQSDRYEAWLKRGKTFLDKENTSIGFQLGGIYYDNKSSFGKRIYNGNQKMLYANLIYQTIIGNKSNKITCGSSFQAEQSEELLELKTFKRNEIVPGIFSEYTFSKNEKLDLVFGLRADYHNNYGLFLTPRFHGRYAFSEMTVVRASAGRGQRTANIFAENIGAMVSARNFIVQDVNSKNPYGLNPEIAWNYGLNLTHDFSQNIQLSIDGYITNFQNQIVIDYDHNPQELRFYNLNGKSFSRSIQSQLDWTLFDGLDLRVAHRYNNVKTTYTSGLLQKPLVSPHRAFANLAYEHKKTGLKFDYTINWQSSKRIASTKSNPNEFRLAEKSDAYYLNNAQVTKVFKNQFELYIGGENIFNFIQQNPIIDSAEPFGNYFDASQVWGPVFGAMWYGGFRYRITRE